MKVFSWYMNPNLKPILKDFREENPNIEIKSDFFQVGAIAYLKENNETMELLLENQEARDEFKHFIKDVLLDKNKDIQSLIANYEYESSKKVEDT